MQNGICPVCGGTKVYSNKRGVAAVGASQLTLMGTKKGFLPLAIYIDLVPFVCGKCGHVTLQVVSEDMDKLHTMLEDPKWTHVQPEGRQNG